MGYRRLEMSKHMNFPQTQTIKNPFVRFWVFMIGMR